MLRHYATLGRHLSKKWVDFLKYSIAYRWRQGVGTGKAFVLSLVTTYITAKI